MNALGGRLKSARRRPKIIGQQRQGTTARVAGRLATLLDDHTAGHRYLTLFKAQSDFLYGQAMQDIPTQVRLDVGPSIPIGPGRRGNLTVASRKPGRLPGQTAATRSALALEDKRRMTALMTRVF